jgi:hypothetical protein
MIPPPPSVQAGSDLTLYAGLAVCAATGLGLLAVGLRSLMNRRRPPDERARQADL